MDKSSDTHLKNKENMIVNMWWLLCKIGKSLSYMKKDFNYLDHVSVEEWYKL